MQAARAGGGHSAGPAGRAAAVQAAGARCSSRRRADAAEGAAGAGRACASTHPRVSEDEGPQLPVNQAGVHLPRIAPQRQAQDGGALPRVGQLDLRYGSSGQGGRCLSPALGGRQRLAHAAGALASCCSKERRSATAAAAGMRSQPAEEEGCMPRAAVRHRHGRINQPPDKREAIARWAALTSYCREKRRRTASSSRSFLLVAPSTRIDELVVSNPSHSCRQGGRR